MEPRYSWVAAEHACIGLQRLCREHGAIVVEYDLKGHLFNCVPLADMPEVSRRNVEALRGAIEDRMGDGDA